MSESLDLKLLGQSCPYVERLCPCIYKCTAPREHPCSDKNQISENEVICKRYNSPIEKVLAKMQNLGR